jgi:hypothetical protein
MACFATLEADAAKPLRAIPPEDPLLAVRKMGEVFGAGVSLDGLEARWSASQRAPTSAERDTRGTGPREPLAESRRVE